MVVQYDVPSDVTNAVSLSAGTDHALALEADGIVTAWGYNPYSQTNVPSSLSNVVQVAAGWYHSLALRADGTVVAWGDQPEPVPADLKDVVAIAAGLYSVALRADGTVVGWSFTMGTSDAQPPPTVGGLKAIAAGAQHAVGLKDDGTVVGWGTDSHRAREVPPGLSNVVAIAAGFSHSVALTADGTVVAWGDNRFGQTNVPPGLGNVVAIACSNRDRFTLALKGDGTAVAWGDGPTLPALSGVISIAAGHDCGLAVVDDLRGAPEVQPAQLTAYTGRQTMFTVYPLLGLPLGYQWQHGGTDIPGATNSILMLPNLELSDAGQYRVLVTTLAGSITSRSGELEVIEGAPWIATAPQDHLGYQGEPVTFRVSVGGSGPFEYQWRFMDADIPGATNAKFTLAGVLPSQAGAYAVQVGNAFGSALSPAAVLDLAQLWTWGDNNNGQVRNDSQLGGIVSIAAGSHHSLALRRDGTVVGWGGDANVGGAAVPPGLSNVVAIAAGRLHSLALKADGTVEAWGDNACGQINVPQGLSNVVSVAAGGYHSLALQASGHLVVWGSNERGEGAVPRFLQDVVAIAARGSFNLALRANGRVYGWGDNWAHLGDVPEDLTNAVAVALGGDFASAVTDQGKVMAWGDRGPEISGFLASLENVVAAAAGGSHLAVLRADGTVASWGSFYDTWEGNDGKPADTPQGMTNVIAVAAGGIHSMALAAEGPPFICRQPLSRAAVPGDTSLFHVEATGLRPLSCQWQFNGFDISGATNATLILPAVSPENAGRYRVCIRNPLGTAWSSEANLEVGMLPRLFLWERAIEQTPLPVDLSGLVDAAVSFEHGVALTRAGTVTAWGSNRRGQTDVPIGLSNVVAIAAGAAHCLALRSDGTVVPWGDNLYGQTNVPAGLENVVAITAGVNHNLALKADGTVVAWGDSSDGQTTLPVDDEGAPLVTNIVAIAAGEDRSLALRADGTVMTWGFDGDYGNPEVPPGLSNVMTIACGTHDSVALRRDGTAIAWGDLNPSPQEIGGGDAMANSFLYWYFYRGTEDGSRLGHGDLSRLVGVQPAHLLAYTGRSARFSVMALGFAPLSYQWRCNGREIPNATNSCLILPDLQLIDGGNYTVAVDSPIGPIGEATTELEVISGSPVIVRQPDVLAAYSGQEALLRVETDGTWPCSFQWFFNGQMLPDATNSYLRLANVSSDQTGDYSVEVRNSYGAVMSREVHLEVVQQQVFAWGDNTYGQTNIPPGLTNIVAVAGNSYHSLALRADGTLAGWGYFYDPVVPEGVSDLVAVACGAAHTLGLLTDGTVIAWGANYNGQTNVPPGLSHVVAVAAGNSHSLVLKEEGTVAVWGDSNGAAPDQIPPDLTNVVTIAAGYYHNLALRSDGTVFSWGWNRDGETEVPSGLGGVVAIAGGYNYSVALKGDGTVVFWGDKRGVLTNLFANEGRVVAIASGTYHVLALRENGTVIGWGHNTDGQTQVPPGLNNVVQIACGRYHSLAMVAPIVPLMGSRLTNPGMNGDIFRVDVPTARGRTYRMEFKDSLADDWWTPLPPLPGNGQERELVDPDATGKVRFYRVRQQP